MNSVDKDQEIIPPPTNKQSGKVKLATVGNISSEMARVYRQVRRGDITIEQGSKLTYMLRQQLEAKKTELAFSLAQDDPDDDRPALVGLTIKGPAPGLPDGATARRLSDKEVAELEANHQKRKKGNGKDVEG